MSLNASALSLVKHSFRYESFKFPKFMRFLVILCIPLQIFQKMPHAIKSNVSINRECNAKWSQTFVHLLWDYHFAVSYFMHLKFDRGISRIAWSGMSGSFFHFAKSIGVASSHSLICVDSFWYSSFCRAGRPSQVIKLTRLVCSSS